MSYGRKVMRLIFYLSVFCFFFLNINVIPFKIVPLGSYTPLETLFPLLVAALEVFKQYGLRHVHHTSHGHLYKNLVDSLKFCVDDSPSVKKTNQHWFDLRFAYSIFLWSTRAHSVLLLTLPLRIVLKNPWFITCDHSSKEILLIGDSVKKIKTFVTCV